ncbi:MAG: TonB-dependent receptor [Gammaproteobacteria bacterium]|nr:TonB-dependent receptor [Gammaproteobacteria bacterium]
MKCFDRAYLIWALSYAACGMGLGIFMAASGNHGQFVTHAHILLVGFVTSLIYAVIHKLWLPAAPRVTGTAQFVLHQAGCIGMFAGLLMLYGRVAAGARLEPLLGSSAVAVILGMLLMLVMVIRAGAATRAQDPPGKMSSMAG